MFRMCKCVVQTERKRELRPSTVSNSHSRKIVIADGNACASVYAHANLRTIFMLCVILSPQAVDCVRPPRASTPSRIINTWPARVCAHARAHACINYALARRQRSANNNNRVAGDVAAALRVSLGGRSLCSLGCHVTLTPGF